MLFGTIYVSIVGLSVFSRVVLGALTKKPINPAHLFEKVTFESYCVGSVFFMASVFPAENIEFRNTITDAKYSNHWTSKLFMIPIWPVIETKNLSTPTEWFFLPMRKSRFWIPIQKLIPIRFIYLRWNGLKHSFQSPPALMFAISTIWSRSLMKISFQ